jgi:predicted RNA binding protein YcfA (HicA-like mRNA interferase family)
MAKLPRDIGSKELIAALTRLGFRRSPIGDGSHRGYYKVRPNGTRITVTVLEGKTCITTGTLNAILKRAEISREDFLDAL